MCLIEILVIFISMQENSRHMMIVQVHSAIQKNHMHDSVVINVSIELGTKINFLISL